MQVIRLHYMLFMQTIVIIGIESVLMDTRGVIFLESTASLLLDIFRLPLTTL